MFYASQRNSLLARARCRARLEFPKKTASVKPHRRRARQPPRRKREEPHDSRSAAKCTDR